MTVARLFLLPSLLWVASLGNAEQPDAEGRGVWWNWDVSREWSSNHRRAKGIIKLYADAEKTQPLKAQSLRFSLELDCPIAVGPELVINEMRDASELGAQVHCNQGSAGKFEVRWRFEAVDSRFGSVSDQGAVTK